MKALQQLELGIVREEQPDRNHQDGGRSFYFFDLDDNVFFLPSSLFIFHKETHQEIELTTAEYALHAGDIGLRGAYRDFELRYDDTSGSYRRFRDGRGLALEQQPFLKDVDLAIEASDFLLKGPSWHCFYHATFNQRPISLITARGHAPATIRAGIRRLVLAGILPQEPNYLTIFPVSHPEIRRQLGDEKGEWSIARLKRAAIQASVQEAMLRYGNSPYHRFGMSDDSPENLQLIAEAMVDLKRQYSANSFFVIDTHGERYVKREIFLDHVTQTSYPSLQQLSLFDL